MDMHSHTPRRRHTVLAHCSWKSVFKTLKGCNLSTLRLSDTEHGLAGQFSLYAHARAPTVRRGCYSPAPCESSDEDGGHGQDGLADCWGQAVTAVGKEGAHKGADDDQGGSLLDTSRDEEDLAAEPVGGSGTDSAAGQVEWDWIMCRLSERNCGDCTRAVAVEAPLTHKTVVLYMMIL